MDGGRAWHCVRVVSEQDAEVAARWHLRALAADALDGQLSGEYEGWRWWRGATRAVWLPAGSEYVFKFERMRFGVSNLEEDRKMGQWRRAGFEWAPQTSLFTVLLPGLSSSTVLAMPYYACVVTHDEIPESALARVDDCLVVNFRRNPGGPVMLIDAG